MGMIAVVRVRGRVNVRRDIRDTLEKLRLRRKHVAVVIPPRRDLLGMVKKAKDYVTWGEIDKETLKELILKRGRLRGDKPVTEEYIKEKTGLSIDEFVEKVMSGELSLQAVGIKPFFRLAPPRGGWERGGIRKPFKEGGALGYRGSKINDLLRRMM